MQQRSNTPPDHHQHDLPPSHAMDVMSELQPLPGGTGLTSSGSSLENESTQGYNHPGVSALQAERGRDPSGLTKDVDSGLASQATHDDSSDAITRATAALTRLGDAPDAATRMISSSNAHGHYRIAGLDREALTRIYLENYGGREGGGKGASGAVAAVRPSLEEPSEVSRSPRIGRHIQEYRHN